MEKKSQSLLVIMVLSTRNKNGHLKFYLLVKKKAVLAEKTWVLITKKISLFLWLYQNNPFVPRPAAETKILCNIKLNQLYTYGRSAFTFSADTRSCH